MKQKHLDNILNSITDHRLQKVLSSIDEFQSRYKLMVFYVMYDRPQCQQHIYMFWMKTLEIVVRNYYQRSQVSKDEIIKWFSFGSFQPMGLEEILNQLVVDGKLIQQNDEEVEKIFRHQQRITRRRIFHPPYLKRIWDSVLKTFKYQITTSAKEIAEESHLYQSYIFVDYLIENIVQFDVLLKYVFLYNEDQIKIFCFKDLLIQNQNFPIETQMNVPEIEFILENYIKFQQVQKFSETMKEGHRIIYYVLTRGKPLDTPEIQKDIAIFQLKKEMENISDVMSKKQKQLMKIDQDLVSGIQVNNPRAQNMALFQQKKLLDKSVQVLQDKKLVILNHLNTLENTINDFQMVETLKKVNIVLDSISVDSNVIRDALDQLTDVQQRNQEINREYYQFVEQDSREVDEEFKKYMLEVEQSQQQELKQVFNNIPQTQIPQSQGMKKQKIEQKQSEVSTNVSYEKLLADLE